MRVPGSGTGAGVVNTELFHEAKFKSKVAPIGTPVPPLQLYVTVPEVKSAELVPQPEKQSVPVKVSIVK